jgi:hypothetical protein
VEVGPTHVGIRPGTVHVDADAFAADVEAERWESGLARWHGEFLPGLEDLDGGRWRHWLDAERSRLTVLRARALAATRVEGGSARTTTPPSVQAAPRWAATREVAVFSPTREITGGLLGTLSTEARAVIEAASVLGRRVEAAPLADVAGLSQNGFASAVEELASRGMLHPGGGEVLEFTSDDARQRVYQLVAADRRRHLHGLAARAVSHAGGLDLDTAEHERLATPPVESSRGRVIALVVLVTLAVAAAAWYLIPRSL